MKYSKELHERLKKYFFDRNQSIDHLNKEEIDGYLDDLGGLYLAFSDKE